MNFRKLILAGTAAAAVLGAPAQASIIDNPQFRVLGLVIVWGADASGGAPIVSDFVIDDTVGRGDTDLINSNVHAVVTGSLTPLTSAPDATGGEFSINGATTGGTGPDGFIDAAAAFGAFGIDETTDVTLSEDLVQRSSFYVASNTAFNIEAQASEVSANGFTLDDIGFSLAVTRQGDDGLAFGSAAQFPAGAVDDVTGQLVDADGNVLEDEDGNPLATTLASASVGLDTVNAENTVPVLDADGNPTGEFVQETVLDADGNPIEELDADGNPIPILDADGNETGFNELTMQDLLVPTLVFEGTRRTAATPGSIAEQSVRFDATYTLGGSEGYDLSDGSGDIETTVTYTVFVP